MGSVYLIRKTKIFGVTVFEFTFNGPQDLFLQKLSNWLSTKDGKRYKLKTPLDAAIAVIQKADWWDWIVIEFFIRKDTRDKSKLMAQGYTRPIGMSFIPRWTERLRNDIQWWKLGYSRTKRNGWKDVLKILDFMGVENFHHHFP
ncbi:MAG: hypothetical protein ACE5OZ_26225 [Candidatus Heimdallarchaeota archaeon]